MDLRAAKPVAGVLATPPVKDQSPEGRSGVPSPLATEEQARPAVPVRDVAQTLQVVAEHMREYLRSSGRDLEFRVDPDADATVITVRNSSSGDIIRQIPSEEALRIMRNLNADSGTFVDIFA